MEGTEMKEQIKAILRDQVSINSTKSLNAITDEILSLPLDVPTDEEIENQFSDPRDQDYERWSINAAKWAIEQVIERNKR